MTEDPEFPDTQQWQRMTGGGAAPAEVLREPVPGGAGFDVIRFAGPSEGPRVAVLGGVHGDEVTGIVAAGVLARVGVPLTRGTLTVVPLAHEAAAAAASRVGPQDGGNLARSFPGDPGGGPTSRLADRIGRAVLDGTDLVVDLHTAGRRYDMPFLAGYRSGSATGDIDAAALAEAFGADVVWEHPALAPGRTISHVEERGGVGLYVESVGGERLDAGRVRSYVRGVLRVLARLGMTEPDAGTDDVLPTARRVSGDGDVDASDLVARADGYFVPAVGAGDVVAAGTALGVLVDRRGEVLQRLVAGRPATVMMVRRAAAVTSTEMLAVLASAGG